MPITHRSPGLVLTEHECRRAARPRTPGRRAITVFAREVADADGRDRPFLRLPAGRPRLRGAPADAAPEPPGLAGPRAAGLPGADARPARHRPVHAGRRRSPGMTPQQQADYLTHFRADSIVRDAELIRRELGVERWSVLGQSFGGFCVDDATSRSPPKACARRCSPAACRRSGARPTTCTARRTARDRAEPPLLRALPRRPRRARELHGGSTPRTSALPSGDRLTPRRFRQLGDCSAWATAPRSCTTCSSCRPARRRSCTTSRRRSPSRATRSTRSCTSRATPTACATRWSAQRAAARRVRRGPSSSPASTSSRGCSRTTARCAPLREAAELLAEHEWPRLYDAERARAATRCRSRRRSTPRTCTSSARSPSRRRPDPGPAAWITNEFEHNGLRATASGCSAG